MKTTWKVANLKSKLDTKMVVIATVLVSFELDGVIDRFMKTVEFEGDPTSPSFIPFEKLTEKVVIDWVKEKLGSDEIVKMEQIAKKSIDEELDKKNNPKFLSQVPWKTNRH